MNKSVFLRWVIYIGAGLLTLTPLIVANGMYFPFITGKAFFFRIIVMIVFAAWAVLALYDKEARPKKSAVSWALGGLIVIAFLAAVFGVNFDDSVWSNFERMMGWITLLHVGLLFTALAHTLNPKQWRWLFYVSLGVSVLVALIGFTEIPAEGRIDGTLGNPIYLAMYALFHLFLAGYLALGRVKVRLQRSLSWYADWQLYVFKAVALFNLIALYFTKTRGAILGLLAGIFVALACVAIFERERKVLRGLAVAGVIIALLAVGSFFTLRDANFMQNNDVLSGFANISLDEGTAGARLDNWQLGLEGYAARPILGWGQGNYNYVFNTYYNPELFEQETWFDRVHNVALEWLIAAGPLGFLAYLALFATAIYLIWKRPEDEGVEGFSVLEKSVLTGLVVSYLVQNLFVFDHLVSYLMLTMLLAWLHARGAEPAVWVQKLEARGSAPAGKAWVGTGVALAALALAIAWNYPGMAQSSTLIDALRTESRSPQAALAVYERAEEYDAMGTQEVRERLVQRAIGLIGNEEITEETLQAYFNAALAAADAQIADEPKDVRSYVFKGRLLLAFGQNEGAVEAFSAANEMSNERKQVILLQLAQAYEAADQPEEALEAYRKAYELDKSFDEPALYLAAGYISQGDEVAANELLSDKFGTTTINSSVLIQAYYNSGNYQALVPIFEARLTNSPDDFQNYVNLAVVYTELNQIGSAVGVLENAATRFPEAAAQINNIIEQIRAGNPVRP